MPFSDAVFDAALEWVVANLEYFGPCPCKQEELVARSQSLAELAVLVLCCEQHVPHRVTPHRDRLAEFFSESWKTREAMDRLLRMPEGISLVGYIYAGLKCLGRAETQDSELVQGLLDTCYLEQNESLPHRTMDVRLALEWGGFVPNLQGWDELCEMSIIAQRLRVPYVTDASAYALTHALFFAVAFGTRAEPAMLLLRKRAVAKILTQLLVTFSLARHWDILGELLLCWECLHLEETVIYRRAWDLFLGQQKDDGAFPGPEKRSARIEHGDSRRQQFRLHYHTTLVALMALACQQASVRKDRRCVVEWDGASHSAEPSSFTLVAAVQRTRLWLTSLLDRAASEGNGRPVVLCRLLVALWLCGEIDDPARTELGPIVGRIASELVAQEEMPKSWSSIPSGLKLISASLLNAHGVSVAPLDSFLEQARTVLGDAPAGPLDEELSLIDKRVFLHAVGLGPSPSLPSVAEIATCAESVDLSDTAAIENLLLRVDACTGFGFRPLSGLAVPPVIPQFVSSATMHYLRVYNLPRACSALRTLSRLGPQVRGDVIDSCDFLLAHQAPQGSFGLFGPEVAELERSAAGFISDEDLHLPVTLDCLWALAEASRDGWWLYSACARR